MIECDINFFIGKINIKFMILEDFLKILGIYVVQKKEIRRVEIKYTPFVAGKKL